MQHLRRTHTCAHPSTTDRHCHANARTARHLPPLVDANSYTNGASTRAHACRHATATQADANAERSHRHPNAHMCTTGTPLQHGCCGQPQEQIFHHAIVRIWHQPCSAAAAPSTAATLYRVLAWLTMGLCLYPLLLRTLDP